MNDDARIKQLERKNRQLTEAMQQAERMRQQWSQAVDALKRTSNDLREANAELTSLYEIATTVNELIALEPLLERIDTLMLDLIDVPASGGVFLVEKDGRMRLASARNATQAFIECHDEMRIGDCLCGQVAVSGEMLVDECSGNNQRHTIRYPDMKPHGHVILPLKARNQVVGVFYYYLPEGTPMPERKLQLLEAVGTLIGLAIDNVLRYEQSLEASVHDPLTGLPNRRYLDVMLKREWSAARRRNRPLAVIMMDIDRFKDFNDTHGHPAGDRLLQRIAELLHACSRDEDLPARYGGEEFLILVEQSDHMDAGIVAERIRAAIENDGQVTASFGVAAMRREDPEPDTLLERADQALYRAKHKGRNRVEFADEEN